MNHRTPVGSRAKRHLARVLAFAATATVAGACAGDADAEGGGETPWVTSVDSTGDTTIVRISGGMPEAHVRSLVPELRVGAEDGSEEETFGAIGTVIGLRNGGLLVHDWQARAVRMFDGTGAIVRTMGGKGGGPGEYDQINGIVRLPDDRIAIWDASGGRLNVYSPTGEFQVTTRMPIQGWMSQNILMSDDSGSLYALGAIERDSLDFFNSRMGYIRMDANGNVLDSLAFIEFNEPVPPLKVESNGGTARANVPFAPQNFTRLMPDGGLVSGFGEEYRFYILASGSAKPVRVEREHESVAVTSQESSERREQIDWMMKRNNPSWTWTGPQIPSHKPAYRGLEVGRDGSIWVLLSMPSEAIPAEEMPPVREGALPTPRLTTRESSVYDVFSRKGRLLGRVQLPPRTRLQTMDASNAWGVQSDSMGVQYAVRFRIEPAFGPVQ